MAISESRHQMVPIQLYHETNFKEVWRNTHKDVNLAEQIEVERRHPVVVRNTREEIHEDKLTVTLSPVARFLFCGCLLLSAALDNDHRRRPSPSNSFKQRYHERQNDEENNYGAL